MNNKMKIMVGIPAYNEEANIGQLVKSLLNQKGDNFVISKIVVVSDGSNDKTVEIVSKIKNKKIIIKDHKLRKGQIVRQNQIIKMLASDDDALLLFEADTLPSDNLHIYNLVNEVNKLKDFSIVCSNKVTSPPSTFTGKVVNFGFRLRFQIFKDAISFPNLYLFDVGLISKKFLKTFKWDQRFHDDSYIYRKAINSRMPILKSNKASIKFKTAETIYDYLIQSGKFQKARQKETSVSTVYYPKIDRLKALKITLLNFVKNPILSICYCLLLALSRLHSHFLPKYTPMWKIYESTKHV